MDYLQELTGIAEANGGIILTKNAAKHGISKAMLCKLCKENQICRIANGQYILPNEIQDEMYSIGLRSSKIIFSHETALFLHCISDRTPFTHTVTAPSDCAPSAAIKEECKIYFIKPELFELGKTYLRTPLGNTVQAYDLERTICDIVRSRSRIGTETYIAALRLYASSPHKNLNRLGEYGKMMHVEKQLMQNLEVLL